MLGGIDANHLERQDLEQLFGAGPRQAWQLMAGLPDIRAANAAAIARRTIIRRMEETAFDQRRGAS